MLAGFRACWRGLRHLEQRGYIYIWANLWWFVLSLPLVTAPAAWAGLMRLGYVAHHSPQANLEVFWDGFRSNLRRGLLLGLLNVLIFGINLVNLWGAQAHSGLAYDLLRGLWLAVIAFWLAVQFYLWPLFYSMEQPSLWGALRNAALMVLLNPLFTLALGLGLALILAFSMVFFIAWALLTAGALAAVANSAVLDRLQAANHETQQRGQ